VAGGAELISQSLNLSFFFFGRGFHYRPGSAVRPPKTDLVSPRPTFPLTSGPGTTTQQLPSRRCRQRSRPSRHHQGRSGRQIRQSRSSGRRGRSSTLECLFYWGGVFFSAFFEPCPGPPAPSFLGGSRCTPVSCSHRAMPSHVPGLAG
jgi:hypothetical protein